MDTFGPTSLELQGNTLYVSDLLWYTVRTFDATTGASLNSTFIEGGSYPPWDLQLYGTDLLTANYNGGSVSRYNAATGALINANFISGLPSADAAIASVSMRRCNSSISRR